MVTTKYHSHMSDVSNYSTIKFYVRIRSTDGNISKPFIVEWCIYHF